MGARRMTERITWSKTTGKAVTHGRVSSYTQHGCRCDECYEAYTRSGAYQRELAFQRSVTVAGK